VAFGVAGQQLGHVRPVSTIRKPIRKWSTPPSRAHVAGTALKYAVSPFQDARAGREMR
jgi:hypothetical protein